MRRMSSPDFGWFRAASVTRSVPMPVCFRPEELTRSALLRDKLGVPWHSSKHEGWLHSLTAQGRLDLDRAMGRETIRVPRRTAAGAVCDESVTSVPMSAVPGRAFTSLGAGGEGGGSGRLVEVGQDPGLPRRRARALPRRASLDHQVGKTFSVGHDEDVSSVLWSGESRLRRGQPTTTAETQSGKQWQSNSGTTHRTSLGEKSVERSIDAGRTEECRSGKVSDHRTKMAGGIELPATLDRTNDRLEQIRIDQLAIQ